ncbi:MAG: hypothetical protein KAR62_04775 [Sphingomonadales bacterium]|nr:hypothetical protein [Sphingomonadales bacterium]
MSSEFIKNKLRTAFPKSADAIVVQAVQEGVFSADNYLEESDILNTVIGRDLRGHIRRAAVFKKLFDLCQNGTLPFIANFKRMPLGSWHFLEIESSNVFAHIHKTDSIYKFPKDTPTRQIERLVNEPDLFIDNNIIPLSEILGKKPLNAWLTMGANSTGELTHVNWCVPAYDEETWLAHIDILQSSRIMGTPPTIPPSTPNPKEKIRFKSYIEEAIKNNDSKKTTIDK